MAGLSDIFKMPKGSALNHSRLFIAMLIVLVIISLIVLFSAIKTIIIPNHLRQAEQRCFSVARHIQYTLPEIKISDLQHVLEKMQKAEPEFSYLLLVDRNGRALAHSNPARIGMVFDDPVSMASCRDGKETRQIYIRDKDNKSSPFYGEKVIDINLPVFDKQQQLCGAIGVGLSLNSTAMIEKQYNQILLIAVSLLLLILALLIKSYYSAIKPMWRAMIENTSRYECLLNTSPDSIVNVGTDGKLQYINASGCRLHGLESPEQLIGHDYGFYIVEEDKPKAAEQVAKCLGGEELHDAQLRLLREDRTPFDVEFNASPLKFDDKLQGMVCIVRNITERKQTEALLARQMQELERKNTEMERFNYTISHDLRSPIITIKGFIGSLVSDARSGNFERMESDIRRIENATDKMQLLLENLRELSRVGRLVNPFSHFPMNKAATEAAELLNASLTAKKIELTIEPDMPIVNADEIRMREVFQNLIENAIKFMGENTAPKISISSRIVDGRPWFYVTDNGIGIDPVYHEKIFGLFDKLDKKTPGTGIGLALVKKIIEVHGGIIRVESAGNGQGTTFIFTLNAQDERIT